MTIIGDAFIRVRPDSTGFGPETEKGVLGQVGSIAKKAAGLLAGAFVVHEGVDFLKSSVDEARESNKVAAQTAAAIKSTGAAAKVSAEQVSQLATAISNKTGIDDEAIQKGENLLLTFTNVRNEVGKGNDVFNQASRTLVDMGAALGGDASSSAIQLGKALNDPIAGITALTRVGVTFTEEQKKQIKAMVESGNTLGAQKVILAELNKEFGGSAAAQATAADRLKVAMGNIKEQIGNVLIPIIDRVATFIADRLPGAISTIGAVFTRVSDAIGPVVRTIGVGISALFAALREGDVTSDGFVGAMERIGDVLHRVGKIVGDFVHGFTQGIDRLTDPQSKAAAIGAQFAQVYEEKVRPALEKVVGFIQDHLRPILLGLGAVLLVAISPVAAVVTAFTLLYTRFAGVRAVVNGVVSALSVFIGFLAEDVLPVVFRVAEVFAHAFDSVVGSITKRLAPLAEAIGHILKVIQVAVTVALAPIILAWRLFGDEILAVVKGAFTAIAAIVKGALRIVGDVIDAVLAVINGDWGKAWDAIRDIPAAALSTLGKVLEAQLRAALAVLTGLGKLVGSAFASIFSGVGRVVGNAVEAAVGVMKGLPGRFASALSGLAGIVLRAIGALPALVVKALEGLAAAGAGVLLQMFLDWRTIFARGVDAVTGFVRTVIGLPGRILAALSTLPGAVADAFVAVWEGAQRVVADAVEGIVSTLAALPGRVAGALGTFAEAVVQVVSNLPGQIVGGLASLGTVVGDLFTRAVQGWGALIRAGIDQAVGFFTELPGRVLAALSALPGVIATSFSLAWKGAQEVVRTAIDGVVGIVTGLPGRLASVLGQLADIGLKLGQGLVGGILHAVGGVAGAAADFAVSFGKAIIDYVNRNVIDRINSVLEFTIESPFPPHARFTVNPPDIPRLPVPKLAGGGLVPATPGGILATIGEGSRPEAVLPLPPGLVEGLQAIASGRGQGALIAGNLVVQGATANAAYVTGVEVVRQLAAEVFRATGGRIA